MVCLFFLSVQLHISDLLLHVSINKYLFMVCSFLLFSVLTIQYSISPWQQRGPLIFISFYITEDTDMLKWISKKSFDMTHLYSFFKKALCLFFFFLYSQEWFDSSAFEQLWKAFILRQLSLYINYWTREALIKIISHCLVGVKWT